MKVLIENGYVVTMNASRAIFQHGFVAIGDNGRIAAVGDMADRPSQAAGMTIDARGMLVLPGLINSHTQPWHFTARGKGQGWDADEAGLLALLERTLSPADRVSAVQLYARHMIRSGTTCVLGHSLAGISVDETKALIEPLRAAGLRLVFAKNFKAGSSKDDIEPLVAEYRPEHSRVTIALAIDTAPHHLRQGRIDEKRIEQGYLTARNLGLRISTRSSGDEGHSTYSADVADAGRSHIMHLMELGVLDESWLVAMPTLVDETDIDLMAEANCNAIYTPTHDAFRGLPPGMFASLSRRLNCALGSGGPLFDPAEDMVEQMKACSMIQNSARLDPTSMPFETSLEMTTINAARALGLEREIGSIEPGKRADIAIFAMDEIYRHVSHKPISTFIATGRGADAQFVFVDGELLLDEGQIVFLDVPGKTSRHPAAESRDDLPRRQPH